MELKRLITILEKQLAGHIYERIDGATVEQCIIIHKDCPLYHNVDIMVRNFKTQEENKKYVE